MKKKTIHICETCNKQYDTADEAVNCEKEHFLAEEKAKKLAEEKAHRQEVILKLWNAYTEDYGENPIDLSKEVWHFFDSILG